MRVISQESLKMSFRGFLIIASEMLLCFMILFSDIGQCFHPATENSVGY